MRHIRVECVPAVEPLAKMTTLADPADFQRKYRLLHRRYRETQTSKMAGIHVIYTVLHRIAPLQTQLISQTRDTGSATAHLPRAREAFPQRRESGGGARLRTANWPRNPSFQNVF